MTPAELDAMAAGHPGDANVPALIAEVRRLSAIVTAQGEVLDDAISDLWRRSQSCTRLAAVTPESEAHVRLTTKAGAYEHAARMLTMALGDIGAATGGEGR